MKIVIYTYWFLPKRVGGTERATHFIASQLSTQHDIHVITSSEDKLTEKLDNIHYTVHRVTWPKTKIIGVIIFWIRIVQITMKIRPDVVHAQGVSMGIPAYIFFKLFKTPYIVYGRGSDVYLRYKSNNHIYKRVIKNSCAVISLTKDMGNKIQELCEVRNLHVIPNGIDLSLKREKILKNDDNINIIFVGGLRKIKGLGYLLEAMEIALRKNNKLSLLIIGEGLEYPKLKHLAEDLGINKKIRFIGKVRNEKVYDYLNISDIFVLPSISEGFPNVILEAMASGLPIITTNFGGATEIIREEINGYVVEPKNPSALAKKILLLASNDYERKKMGIANQEAVQMYDWNKIIKKINDIYLKCIKP